MSSIPWGKSLEIFSAGFGGVFICLLILLIFVIFFSKIIHHTEKSGNDNGG
jgi:Na+-transporting methylmalonyl-CoA/oxaloacetate decarboxylase gamma subunit